MTANSHHKDASGALKSYRDKRSAGQTPEPFGSSARVHDGGGSPLRFVVHQHAARRLHYDFRLEWEGVLVSWAVPRGPSLNPADKRLAVQVEPHPLEYGDFEGRIPEGNYGAGSVIIWDSGVWVPVDDPSQGWDRGKLLFDLQGYKLRGRWTLVRTHKPRSNKTSKEWLLIKKPDGYADANGAKPLSQTSVLSGMTVEELGQVPKRVNAIVAALDTSQAPRAKLNPKRVSVMLCEPMSQAFDDPDWIYELKYDGYRLLAGADRGVSFLRYRQGREVTQLFPEIARVVGALPYESFLLDGEVVVLEQDGRPNFSRLQTRAQRTHPGDLARVAREHPVTYVVFDLLAFHGFDLRCLPLLARRQLLRQMLPPAGPLRYVDYIAETGVALYNKVVEMGLEGIVAKRKDAAYVGRRSSYWKKIRRQREADFAIVGFTTGEGVARRVGALHLGQWNGTEWVYAGRVGTGFTEQDIAALYETLVQEPVWQPTFDLPTNRGNQWVVPRLVCTVRYMDWNEGGLLRHTTFLRLRADKTAMECRFAVRQPPALSIDPTPGQHANVPRQVKWTNKDKVFWPTSGYTKGDLVSFYRDIGPWILPYLRDRPVVLTRYPDGISGKSFFQKDAPSWVPDWVHTETIWSEHAQREIHYFVCDDVDTLVYLANLGTIPVHVWSSRLQSLSLPDWCILDLDPKGAPFAHVIRCARAIHQLCNEIALVSYVKTSGSSGLHILIALGGVCTYEQSRHLAHLIARVVEMRLGDIATTKRMLDSRGGRVYLDYGQNGHGRLLVAPFSVRARPLAPVSTPIHWRELSPRLSNERFTIRTVLRRVRRQKRDPLLGVLGDKPDLRQTLDLLAEKLNKETE